MCIVIDINTLVSVFDKKSSDHNEFKDVLEWIANGKGKIVYGGTKYINELAKTKYLSLFVKYNKAQKAIFVKDNVDSETYAISQMLQHPDFDDQHIVALLRVSGCKLICSLDARAYPFLQHDLFFTPAKNKPKIYSSKKNKDLLTDKNIAAICRPARNTTNEQRRILPV